MRFPDLTPVFGPIAWAVIGAAATRLYMPERATRDLDIVLRSEDASEARRKLTEARYEYGGELSVGGSSWLSPEGIPVDVLEMTEPWLDQALEAAGHNRDSQGLPVLPLSYLILTKFRAGRVQDLADMSRMLGQAEEKMLGSVRQLFARYAPADLEDVESLIALGRLEMPPPPEDDG